MKKIRKSGNIGYFPDLPSDADGLYPDVLADGMVQLYTFARMKSSPITHVDNYYIRVGAAHRIHPDGVAEKRQE